MGRAKKLLIFIVMDFAILFFVGCAPPENLAIPYESQLEGRRDFKNESVTMRIYPLFDWGGHPREDWNTVAEYVEVEIQGENFPGQLIPLLRQHISWLDWEKERRISIRDMWFIDNTLFVDFYDVYIWDNQGTSGEYAVSMSLYRSLASLAETEDVAEIVFLLKGAEGFTVGGHGGVMGRLDLNCKDTLYMIGLIK